MADFNIHKVTALPGTLQANSMYVVTDGSSADHVEVYFTNNAGTASRHLPTKAEIDGWIAAAIASAGAVRIVADIQERNALTLNADTVVLVLNASADTTVASGAATYAYRKSNTSWTKISEAESMDVALSWANLAGKPASAVGLIDDAVTKRHEHANKTQLDKIGQDAQGHMTYDGNSPRISWNPKPW
jgi:hypothetical protein